MEESKQHAQLPNDMLKIEDMEPKDLIVYLTIKRHLDANTKTAKISFENAAKKLGCSEKTIRNSVNKLVSSGYIKIGKEGKYNVYSFPKPDNGFEKFYVDFIDNPEMTYQQKAFYAAQQQHMRKENGLCKNTYNIVKLSDTIHMDPKTIRKYENEFKEKGWMIETKTQAIDSETGCKKLEKIYFPEKFGQAMLFIAAKHEVQLQNQEERISSLEKDIHMLKTFIENNIKEQEIQPLLIE